MPKLKLTWQTKQDDRVCPICRALDGHEWVFDLGVDAFPDYLEYGGKIVYDTNRGSKAHGHTNDNCRCKIKDDFDQSDLLTKIEQKYREITSAAGAPAT